MRQTSFADFHCSLAQSLEVVGDWWSPLIIRDVAVRINRFDDIVEDLGISRNLLATRLEDLEANGILELAGSMSLVDVRSDYRLPIPEGDWTTLGGYTFARLGRVPRIGDRATFPGGELEVVAMDGRRVAAVRVVRQDERGRRVNRPATGTSSANHAASPRSPT